MFIALYLFTFGFAAATTPFTPPTPPTGPIWTWPASQELFQTYFAEPLTGCEWTLPAENVVTMPGSQFTRPTWTGYGFCAPTVESCMHVGTIPRPTTLTTPPTPNCTYCCARPTCFSFPPTPTGNDDFQHGYCMLPKVQPFTPTNTTYTTTTFYDTEEQTCMKIGGFVATDNATWWGTQCPMSGRCCLYPEYNECQTCGRKYGKEWNWSKPAMAKSNTHDEMLAWKTAVNQMAGTGYGFGMAPVPAPGFSEQYSQTPPTYDSLVPPQLWNNFLNRPTTMKKTTDDDDDEDDHRGWCWQAAIMSKLDGSLRCGGAMISDRYILTTASCASFTSDTLYNYKIRMGGTDMRRGDEKHAMDFDIAEVFIHPEYNSTTWSNNIAIIELKSAVTCNNKYICTICLPSINMMGFPNFFQGHTHQQFIKDEIYQCLATGWGRKTTGTMSYTPYLKEMIYAPIFNNQTYCETSYNQTYSKWGHGSTYGTGTFCAIPQPTVMGTILPICQGDNGGPMACFYNGRYYLTGLTWGGSKCDYNRKTDNIVAKVLQPNYKADVTGSHVDFFVDVVKYIPWIYGVMYTA